MLGRKVKHDLVGGVVQKGCPAFHRLQDPTFALDAQRLRCDPFALSDPAQQGLGLMDIQIIQDHVPLRRGGIAGNQALEMSQGILLGAGRSPGRFDDLPGDDIKIDEPGQRAMPDVLEFASQHMTRLHGQVRMLALDGLHAAQFIQTDAAFALLSPLRRLGIDLTPLDNLFVSALVGHFG